MRRQKKDIQGDVSTYFLIAGSSCGLIPDKHIIPPGEVKLQSVAESILRGPWIKKRKIIPEKEGKIINFKTSFQSQIWNAIKYNTIEMHHFS